MRNAAVFMVVWFVVIAGGFAAVVSNVSFVANYANFSEPVFLRAISTEKINVVDLVAAKLSSAGQRREAFSVGLFGNSRAVMVSGSDIGLKEGEFFNFSIGGTSFVQSVRSVEHLAAVDRLPDRIFISVDHPINQYVGYYSYPNPAFELGYNFSIALSYLDNGTGDLRRRAGDAVKVLDLGKKNIWREFLSAFSFDAIRNRLDYWAAVIGWRVHDRVPDILYRADGSRSMQLGAEPYDASGFVAPTGGSRGWDRSVYLGLVRLGRIARETGATIIVYESPLHPNIDQSLEDFRPEARETRRWFDLGCEVAAITCVHAPKLASTNRDVGYWPDCCHAPGALLGKFLRKLVEDEIS